MYFRQPRYEPLSQFEQTVLLTAALGHAMQNIPFEKIGAFKKGFLAYIQREAPELRLLVKDDTALDVPIREKIIALAETFRDTAEF